MTTQPTKPDRAGVASGTQVRSNYQVQLDEKDARGGDVPPQERLGMFELNPFMDAPKPGDRVRLRFYMGKWQIQ